MPSSLRSRLVRIAAQLPKGDDTRREILAALQRARAVVTAAGPKLPPAIDGIVRDAVEDAIQEVGDAYESYNNQIIEPGGRGYYFGSGSDGGYGGEASTYLHYLSSTGGWPSNSKLSGLQDAEEKAYNYGKSEWIRANKAFMEANGLTDDQISYSDLEELGFSSEAESLDEYERGAMEEEYIGLRLGAFFYGRENSLEGRKGELNMYVFAVVDCDGHFLPSRPITTFETTFAFKDARDLKGKLDKAVQDAANSLM